MSGKNLGTLLARVTERSTREVETLIDELQGLRKKLEVDRDRIQSEIAGTKSGRDATDLNHLR